MNSSRFKQGKIISLLPSFKTYLDLVFDKLPDPEEFKNAYRLFNNAQGSATVYLIMAILRMVLHAIEIVTFTVYSSSVPHLLLVWASTLLILLGWAVYLLRRSEEMKVGAIGNEEESINMQHVSTNLQSYLPDLYIFGSCLYAGLYLIAKQNQGHCDSELVLQQATCNPFAHLNGPSLDALMIALMMPLVLTLLMPGVRFRTAVLSLGTIIACLAVTGVVSGSSSAWLPRLLIVYTFAGAIIICEQERQKLRLFAVTERLTDTLVENELLADETRAKEMRHMVSI